MLYNKAEERTVADGYALADLFTEEKNRLLGHFGRFFLFVLLAFSVIAGEDAVGKSQNCENHDCELNHGIESDILLHNTDPPFEGLKDLAACRLCRFTLRRHLFYVIICILSR